MKLVCPRCLTESVIRLDLDDGETMTCEECNDTFTVADLVAILESWSKLLPWLKACPTNAEQANAGQAEAAAV